jgi:hypothetical protein
MDGVMVRVIVKKEEKRTELGYSGGHVGREGCLRGQKILQGLGERIIFTEILRRIEVTNALFSNIVMSCTCEKSFTIRLPSLVKNDLCGIFRSTEKSIWNICRRACAARVRSANQAAYVG